MVMSGVFSLYCFVIQCYVFFVSVDAEWCTALFVEKNAT